MRILKKWEKGAVVIVFTVGLASAQASEIYKAANALPLNDPASWEGGTVPGAEDVAVFDERVTAGTTAFVLTNSLTWRGVVLTNTAAPAASGTISFSTNGTDAATLSLGMNGVCLAGSGLGLTLNMPIALSEAQTWRLDRRNLTFNSVISGSSDWVLNMASQTYWYAASGYNGNLTFTNSANATAYFFKAGRWAKSLTGDTGRVASNCGTPIRRSGRRCLRTVRRRSTTGWELKTAARFSSRMAIRFGFPITTSP